MFLYDLILCKNAKKRQNEKKQNLESGIKSLAIESKGDAEELRKTLWSLENVDVLLQLKAKERELRGFVDVPF